MEFYRDLVHQVTVEKPQTFPGPPGHCSGDASCKGVGLVGIPWVHSSQFTTLLRDGRSFKKNKNLSALNFQTHK